MWLWSRDRYKILSVCRDAARRAGMSATAELLVLAVMLQLFFNHTQNRYSEA